MSRTDTPTQTTPASQTPLHESPMTATAPGPLGRLITLTTTLTLVLTIALTALPTIELLTTPTTPTPPAPTTAHTTTPTSPTTPDNPRTTRADKAAAAHDGCRQSTPTPTTTGDLISRPSCRSGMPVTRDHMTQAPDTTHPHHTSTHPAPMNEVPPSWSGHWRQAAHSPYHRSQA